MFVIKVACDWEVNKDFIVILSLKIRWLVQVYTTSQNEAIGVEHSWLVLHKKTWPSYDILVENNALYKAFGAANDLETVTPWCVKNIYEPQKVGGLIHIGGRLRYCKV